ncbi:cis-2,3-dihydrobiphenyl-2,3-diol dehydrogenase-like [Dreissena polymorpha]|uniref:Uncharacterized protein n=1 Tax=Dreissena polymorpha TaxID=45954 RepID=A0A9D4HMV5_DREPO|nr:cis-2,3-dihydrobiphenyl-2,3-diol dehydrogenase-like [Dreissena polymorpha]KAH3722211.1 hypothetical protein DPMN_065167 [Dreissena polymorpha]
MALSGRTAFVAGGSGTVGSGIVRSFLQQGAKVAVSSRVLANLNDLKAKIEPKLQKNLILIEANAATEAGAHKILQQLEGQGGVHHVVSSFGAWWEEGPLTSRTVAEFDAHIDERAKSHFIVAKTFLPVLAKHEGSSYMFITGMFGESCSMAAASMLAIAGACVYGIAQAALAEFQGSKVTINEMRIGLMVQPKLTKDVPAPQVGHDSVGDLVISLAQSRTPGVVKIISRDDLKSRLGKNAAKYGF